jgi:hypothetical protein
MARSGEIWSGEFTVRRRNGTEFVAHVRDVLVFDISGRLIGIVGISRQTDR